MKVSVVIPAYNAEKFVNQAVETVLAQETNFPFEVIVVDDGSTDNTAEVVRQKFGDRVRVISQDNRGVSGARNTGIEAAKGELIAMLDSDDYWLPGKLQAQVDFFDSHPDSNIGLMDTFTEIVNNQGKIIEVLDRVKHGESFKELLGHNIMNQPSSMMFPKKVFEAVGGFDRELEGVEDYEFSLRVARKYEIHTIEAVYCGWVHHSENVTLNFERQHAQSLKLRKKLYERYPEVDEKEYKRLLAKSLMYFIPWYFRGGRYGDVIVMAVKMVRYDPSKITSKAMLFAMLACLGPVGRKLHRKVARDKR